MIFSRQKVLTAKTNVVGLVERFPIIESSKLKPSWLKDMGYEFEVQRCPVKTIANMHGTMKGCSGVNMLFDSGFIVRAWSDMSVLIYPDGSASFATSAKNKQFYTVHSPNEVPYFLKNKVVIKLHNPWNFYGDNIKYLYVATPYHSALSRGTFIPHGLLEFKHQHGAHIFLCADVRPEPYEILIKAGEPLCQLIPLTEKKVAVKNIFEQNILNNLDTDFYFVHGYKRARQEEKSDQST